MILFFQVESQTSITTCYRIPRRDEFSINYSVNIVEIQGLNDTSFDKQINIQVRKLFESVIHSLQAVCIVIPESVCRITKGQLLIYNNILKLFGANIRNIIYPCITFDDGGDIRCLTALEPAEIPFSESFIFNNSDLFRSKPFEGYWNRRRETLKKFFLIIGCNDPHCLESSKRVLKTRECVTIQLENIQEKLRNQIQIMNTITKEKRLLTQFESEIKSSRDYTHDESMPNKVKYKSEKPSLNCKVCQHSCHKNCNIPFNVLVGFCEVFSSSKCTICQNKCSTDKHERENYVYETDFENVKRTREEKYNNAKEGQEKHKRMMEIKKAELRTSLKDMKDTLAKVEELFASLNNIALKIEHFSFENFLDDFIDIEKTENEYEFRARKDFLQKIKITLRNNEQLENLVQEICTETL